MSLSSMTGYASAAGGDGEYRWTWEIKSVNGRGLDIRCRLPPTLEGLEPQVRTRLQARFRRGSVTAVLTLVRPTTSVRLRLNPAIVEQLEEIVESLSARVKVDTPRLDGLLALKGVVESVEEEESPAAREAREAAMLQDLEAAIDALDRARREEGGRLAVVLAEHLDGLQRLSEKANATAALQPEAIRARLNAQVATLLEAAPQIAAERLAQEAALLATRADVREELDRLRAHVAAARDLLAEGDAVGRRLDFLCQELNREANTICSKSADIELTRIGLDMKAAVEQLREQVQNIE
jgi:uncharacterized protein (TIGR00255 family)